MQDLTEKNTDCPRSWKSAEPNFRPHWPRRGSPKRPPLVIYPSNDKYLVQRVCRSDNKIADGTGLNPDKQQLLRQLKAGESMLTRVR